jgi:nitroreductase
MKVNHDVFEVMSTMRAMRGLKPDKIPEEVIRKILQAGTWAPNGQNLQPYRFIVVSDADKKKFFGTHYAEAMRARFSKYMPSDNDNSSNARNIRVAMKFGDKVHDAPTLIVVCGLRDWPFSIPEDQRVGVAPPSYASVYPCIQNILIACRAEGIGASLTTMHQVFEQDLCECLSIPQSYGIVAVIPIGYPTGKFGPVSRRDVSELTYYDTWTE